MICQNCNRENENSAKFCCYCGTPLNGEEERNAYTQPPQYTQAPPQYNNVQQPPYGQPPYPGAVPPPYGNQPPIPQINQSTYLVWAILTTLFCCLPLGIASIVYASKINGFMATGNYMMAQDSAKKSKTFSIIAACLGGGLYLLYFILMIIGAATFPY